MLRRPVESTADFCLVQRTKPGLVRSAHRTLKRLIESSATTGSDLDLFSDGECIFVLDAELRNRTFQLEMTEEEPNCSEVPRRLEKTSSFRVATSDL